MIKWKKSSKKVTDEVTTIRYESAELPGVTIESRKRKIRQDGGNNYSTGKDYWEHTTYFLIRDGAEKEFWSMKDAKEAAEK